jgi:hypothetical protein
MTLASALYGGGAATEYLTGVLYPARALGVGSDTSVVNQDYITPFSVRKAATVDKVAWYRDNTTAGNAYVGIYNSAGTLLTDCAVDANTTVGWHLVETTNIALLAGRIYYCAANVSVDIAGTFGTTGNTSELALMDVGLNVAIGGSGGNMSNAYTKARTNAALLSSLTLTGWASANAAVAMGWVSA